MQWFNPPTVPTYSAQTFAPPVPSSITSSGAVYDVNAPQQVSNALIGQEQGYLANVIGSNPCPFETADSGLCCAEGQIVNSAGQCASSTNWTWILITGAAIFGTVLIMDEFNGRRN